MSNKNELIKTNGQKIVELPEDIMESLLFNGDVSKLNQNQKMIYYAQFCKRIGLDPATQPFKLIKFPKTGREILYCDRGGAQQLNRMHKISHQRVHSESINNVYVVFMRATDVLGRYTDSSGAVDIAGKRGDDLANALMKAETKAKRRATLDLCGLGIIDESELETIPELKEPEKLPKDGKPMVEIPKPKVNIKEDELPKPAPIDDMKAIYTLALKNGWTKEHVEKYVEDLGYEPTGKIKSKSGELFEVYELNSWDYEDTEEMFSQKRTDEMKKNEKELEKEKKNASKKT